LWEPPVSEHIEALCESGLISRLEQIYVGLVGNIDNCNNVKNYLKGRIRYQVVDEKDVGWEQVTMECIRTHIQSHQGCVLYAHTKGSSDPSQINIEWRKSMTYFDIYHWHEAYDKLKTYDVVGCHWLTHEKWENVGIPIFAGTFWWANIDYLKTLPPLMYFDRWNAEHWIGCSSKPIKAFDMNPGWPGFQIFKKAK